MHGVHMAHTESLYLRVNVTAPVTQGFARYCQRLSVHGLSPCNYVFLSSINAMEEDDPIAYVICICLGWS